MSHIINVGKEPERRTVKPNDKESLNWLPRLSYFDSDFFLVTTGLLFLEKYSKAITCSSCVYYFPYF